MNHHLNTSLIEANMPPWVAEKCKNHKRQEEEADKYEPPSEHFSYRGKDAAAGGQEGLQLQIANRSQCFNGQFD